MDSLYLVTGKMAILGILVPDEIVQSLKKIDVPGDRVPEKEAHITLVYLGDNIPINTIMKAIMVAYEVSEKVVPFALSLDRVSCFPKGDDGVPVITRVESPELHKLHRELCKGLDKARVDYSKKFPEYKPHVTLSYSSKDVSSFSINPLEWTSYEMVLWGGDNGGEQLSVKIPFSLPGKQALYRTLVQARVRFR